jgi:hypothetical protein
MNSYARFEMIQNLKAVAAYALVAGMLVLLAGAVGALNVHANVRIEARCQEQGGQVLVTPGELSRCLLPTAR